VHFAVNKLPSDTYSLEVATYLVSLELTAKFSDNTLSTSVYKYKVNVNVRSDIEWIAWVRFRELSVTPL
jgi:hypothetical protein